MGDVKLQIRDPRKALLAKNKPALRNVAPGTHDEEYTGELLRAAIIARGATSSEDEYAIIFKNQDGSGRQFALRMSGADVGELIKHLCTAQR